LNVSVILVADYHNTILIIFGLEPLRKLEMKFIIVSRKEDKELRYLIEHHHGAWFKMSGELPSFAKYIFLLGFLVSIIVGIWSFLSPDSWSSITGWPLENSSVRLVGSFLLMLAIAAILAFRAKTWKEVEIYVLVIIIWTLIGAIGMVWSILTEALPIIGWYLTGLLVLFFVLYIYVYYKCK